MAPIFGVEFSEPAWLWLGLAPLLLLAFSGWRLWCRRGQIKSCKERRIVPADERFSFAGSYAFWVPALIASLFSVVAVARPEKNRLVRLKGSMDIVVVLDGSASMRVKDVFPNRWQRSMRFVNVLVQSLPWRGDRMAVASFAAKAWPQVYLTRDANTVLFFLAGLEAESPFALYNDAAWDTNLPDGINWSVKLLKKDEKANGRNPNPKGIVIISDGQSWSGDAEIALATCRDNRIPVFVVGVGTETGGKIIGSEFYNENVAIYSALDRKSLQMISRAGGGEYYELGRTSDQSIVDSIIRNINRRAGEVRQETVRDPLYWYFLCAAYVFLLPAIMFVRRIV